MHSRKLAAAAIIGIILSACSQQTAPQNFSPPAVPVLAQEAGVQDVPTHFESIGTLKPSALVEIRPQVSGMLEAVHFTEGDEVKKGTHLFSIEYRPYEIRLHEAEAQLAHNKAALDIAHKTLNRYNNLASKDLIPQQEWDQLQSQATKEEAQIKANEAKVESANLDLQRCNITAPIDGKIGKILIHPGNLVSAGQTTPLASMSKIDILNVEFTLTEKEFQQLSAQQRQEAFPVEICTFNSQTEACQGMLTFFDHSYDTQTGLLYLQAKLDNPHLQFLPGQHVHVKVPIQIIRNAIVVPEKSVKINQQGPYVYTIKDDMTVEMRPVKLGDEVGEDIVVLEGLAPKELIVTEGHLRLFPGLKVEIKQPGNP
jgi:membrane fusion protein, multidrug efflux system